MNCKITLILLFGIALSLNGLQAQNNYYQYKKYNQHLAPLIDTIYNKVKRYEQFSEIFKDGENIDMLEPYKYNDLFGSDYLAVKVWDDISCQKQQVQKNLKQYIEDTFDQFRQDNRWSFVETIVKKKGFILHESSDSTFSVYVFKYIQGRVDACVERNYRNWVVLNLSYNRQNLTEMVIDSITPCPVEFVPVDKDYDMVVDNLSFTEKGNTEYSISMTVYPPALPEKNRHLRPHFFSEGSLLKNIYTENNLATNLTTDWMLTVGFNMSLSKRLNARFAIKWHQLSPLFKENVMLNDINYQFSNNGIAFEHSQFNVLNQNRLSLIAPYLILDIKLFNLRQSSIDLSLLGGYGLLGIHQKDFPLSFLLTNPYDNDVEIKFSNELESLNSLALGTEVSWNKWLKSSQLFRLSMGILHMNGHFTLKTIQTNLFNQENHGLTGDFIFSNYSFYLSSGIFFDIKSQKS